MKHLIKKTYHFKKFLVYQNLIFATFMLKIKSQRRLINQHETAKKLRWV